jgi:hypothetical protein
MLDISNVGKCMNLKNLRVFSLTSSNHCEVKLGKFNRETAVQMYGCLVNALHYPDYVNESINLTMLARLVNAR